MDFKISGVHKSMLMYCAKLDLKGIGNGAFNFQEI